MGWAFSGRQGGKEGGRDGRGTPVVAIVVEQCAARCPNFLTEAECYKRVDSITTILCGGESVRLWPAPLSREYGTYKTVKARFRP